jgi:radical SAM protein with 4Fe4S-binding SPASM domain
MAVLTNGKAVPCCRDYDYEIDVGSLAEQSLEEVWGGERYERLRRLHAEGQWDRLPICNDCDTWMMGCARKEVDYVDTTIRVTKAPYHRMISRIPAKTTSAPAKRRRVRSRVLALLGRRRLGRTLLSVARALRGR